MRSRMCPAVFAALVLCACPPAFAQTPGLAWPTRPIEMIIPFAAGGGVDVIGRAMAAAMGASLGQTIVVTNRDGAGGTLGFGQLASSAADGYTLGFGPTTPISNAPYLVKGVKYQVESFDYICQVFENVFSLAVGPTSPVKSAAELLNAAKGKPLSYGHAGVGSIPHLSVENLGVALDLKFTAVPFRGDAAFLPVLLKGDLDFGAPAVSSIQGLPIRPLVVFSDARLPALPDVPTARELGVGASVPPGFNGLYAPKGLPTPTKLALERACAAAVRQPSVLGATATLSQTVSYLDSTQFHDRTAADYAFKGQLIGRLGLTVQ